MTRGDRQQSMEPWRSFTSSSRNDSRGSPFHIHVLIYTLEYVGVPFTYLPIDSRGFPSCICTYIVYSLRGFPSSIRTMYIDSRNFPSAYGHHQGGSYI